MLFAKGNHKVQTLASDCANQPFAQRITYTFEDADQKMSAKGEISHDDVNWDDDIEIAYHRAS